MTALNYTLLLMGGLFMLGAIALGRRFNAQRDRSIRVPVRVTGFRERMGKDEHGMPELYHIAQFEVTDGPHAGTTGESSVPSSAPLYDVGDEVPGMLDTENGKITGSKGMSATQFGIVGATLIGALLLLCGIYLRF